MDGGRDRGRERTKRNVADNGERRRTQSYGGEARKRRVSFADETEDEERARLLETGLSLYGRHKSTHYSSKEILLAPPSPRHDGRVTSPRRDGESGSVVGNGVRRGNKLERVFSINGRKVERTNMCLKPIHVDDNNNMSAAAICFSTDDGDDEHTLTRFDYKSNSGGVGVLESVESVGNVGNFEVVGNVGGTDKTAKMVVNSRRQYKVLLPTGNPNVTISVRSSQIRDDEDEERGDWNNPGDTDDGQHLQMCRRSLQEPLKASSVESALRNASSCSYMPSENNRLPPVSPSKDSYGNQRRKENVPPLSRFDDDDTDDDLPQDRKPGHPSFYHDLGRNVYNTNDTGDTGYYPIMDNGLKLVETTPTKLVSLLRPLFELKQEKMDSMTRKNKRKLKRCVSLGRYRMKGEEEEEDEEDEEERSNNKVVVRRKFYELGRNGWMNGRLNGTVAKRGALKVDGDISKILEKYTSAVLSVGGLQLAF